MKWGLSEPTAEGARITLGNTGLWHLTGPECSVHVSKCYPRDVSLWSGMPLPLLCPWAVAWPLGFSDGCFCLSVKYYLRKINSSQAELPICHGSAWGKESNRVCVRVGLALGAVGRWRELC